VERADEVMRGVIQVCHARELVNEWRVSSEVVLKFEIKLISSRR
jgi:hypothetical protein